MGECGPWRKLPVASKIQLLMHNLSSAQLRTYFGCNATVSILVQTRFSDAREAQLGHP